MHWLGQTNLLAPDSGINGEMAALTFFLSGCDREFRGQRLSVKVCPTDRAANLIKSLSESGLPFFALFAVFRSTLRG